MHEHEHALMRSKIKHLLQKRDRLLRIVHVMADRPGILIDFIVVPTLESLVAEEVDGGVIHAVREVLLVLNVL